MSVGISLKPITTLDRLSTINANFERIEEALEDAVSRSGNTPNQMAADFDLNSNDILNVDSITATTAVVDNLIVDGVSFDGNAQIVLASQAEAELASNNTKISTPLRVGQAIDARSAVFDDKTAVTSFSPISAPEGIILKGYTSAGDGGGAIYKKVNSQPSHPGKFSITLADGVTVQWYELAERSVPAAALGVGTATADNKIPIANAFAVAVAQGKNVQLPAGDLIISGALTFDYSAIDIGGGEHPPSWYGSGAASTRLLFAAGSYDAITIIGQNDVAGVGAPFLSIADLAIIKPSLDKLGAGLVLNEVYFADVSRVRVYGFNFGIYAAGLISSKITQPWVYGNNVGIYLDKDSDNTHFPNAILIEQPYISGNSVGGVFALAPSTLTVKGGSIENNGTHGTSSYGLRVDDGGAQGFCAVNVEGVYFEDNAGDADIYLYQSSGGFDCTHNIVDNTFNRISSSHYTTNNIRIDFTTGGRNLAVKVSGNGFGASGSYVENSARPYIDSAGTGPYALYVDGSNIFESTTAQKVGLPITGPVSRTNIRTFTSGTSYIPTVGLVEAVVECVGAGGGGGGVTGAVGQSRGGGGGAAGTYSKVRLSSTQIGASQTITIGTAGTTGSASNGGTGGSTSFGSLCTAPGGGGGNSNDNSTVFGEAGVPGATGTGDISIAGGGGGQGLLATIATIAALGGRGGSPTLYGSGAREILSFGSAAGRASLNYGSGGGGGAVVNTATNVAGGTATAGLVVVTEHLAF